MWAKNVKVTHTVQYTFTSLVGPGLSSTSEQFTRGHYCLLFSGFQGSCFKFGHPHYNLITLHLQKGPQKSSAMDLQSWMTFFTLVFAFMGITEVYDETEVMIFKPKLYEKLYGAGRDQRAVQDDEQ